MNYITRLRVWTLSILCLFVSASAEAATAVPDDTLSMQRLFAAMPDSVLPLLSRNDRLDLVDYASAGARAAVRNRLGGESVLKQLDGVRAELILTSYTSVVFTLEADSKHIRMDIRTLAEGVSCHTYRYYDIRWNEIRNKRHSDASPE